MGNAIVDDLGSVVPIGGTPRRVVSLVPSLTEAIASVSADLLVGCTDWCTHPPGLTARRVGGTKWPDLQAILALKPDLVIANAEENRAEDLDALRSHGVPVYVTAPSTLDTALESLRGMFTALGVAEPAWIASAADVWAVPDDRLRGLRTAAFIWRRPWMVVGRDTFAGDVISRLGLVNVYGDHADRYPKLTPAEVAALDVDVVLLPDEPYVFTPSDGPEAFLRTRTALVSGRHLTWYGPSLVEARTILTNAIINPVVAL